ncbi:MAG: hypothetical protein JKY66_06620 [Spongiibacteraceae bacterium]|nr:hypothetical protein [Spongiibacteraceae bacterium]
MGGGSYLYEQNRDLSRDITASAGWCESHVAALERQYLQQHATVVSEIEQHRKMLRNVAQKDGGEQEKKIEENPEKEKVQFNKLVSRGHQMRAIGHKYEFLLQSARVNADEKKRLQGLLMERERLVNTIEQQALSEQSTRAVNDNESLQSAFSEVEEQIHALLSDPVDYGRYQYLKQKLL